MAIQRLTIDGYGQLEINNAAFRRDGRIEAQCSLDATDFASTVAENGMILAVNRAKKKVYLPTSAHLAEAGSLIAINYSAEHLYDERHQGLKEFYLGKDDVRPRLGFLSVGDKFCTNTICYNTSTFANDAALKAAIAAWATTPVYGCEHESGAILLSTTAPSSNKVTFVVTGEFTMPDGTYGVKLQVTALA